MRLTQSRVRNTIRLLSDIEENQAFYLGVNLSDSTRKIIEKKLNVSNLYEGLTIFPTPLRNYVGKKCSW